MYSRRDGHRIRIAITEIQSRRGGELTVDGVFLSGCRLPSSVVGFVLNSERVDAELIQILVIAVIDVQNYRVLLGFDHTHSRRGWWA